MRIILSKKGASLTEYVVLMSVIGAVFIGVVLAVGNANQDAYRQTNGAIQGAFEVSLEDLGSATPPSDDEPPSVPLDVPPPPPPPPAPTMELTTFTPRSVSVQHADANAFVRSDVNNTVALGAISNNPSRSTDSKIVFVNTFTPGWVVCSHCYFLTASQFPLINPYWLTSDFMSLRVTDWQPATNGAMFFATDILRGGSVSNTQSHYICAWSGDDCLSGVLVDLFSPSHSERAARAFCEAMGQDVYVSHTTALTPADFSPNVGPLPVAGFIFKTGNTWTERGGMNLPAGVPLLDQVVCGNHI